jgi:hypothetical protein
MVESSENFISTILNNFDHKPTSYELSQVLGINETNTLKYIHKFEAEDYVKLGGDWTSSYETEIMNLFPGGEQSNRSLLKGKEIDILYDDQRIGIEFNGNYWHSHLFKAEKDHQNKSIDALKHGIRIIQIFEYEWNDKKTKEKLIKLIDKSLNPYDRVKYQARKCTVQEIDKGIAKEFIDKYHLQNWANADICIGLYSDEELLGVMTFGTPRFDRNCQYELIRLAWKDGIMAVGGANKLFTYFIEKYNPSSIVSYCNMAKFSGSIYELLGFKFIEYTRPNYVWTNLSNSKVLSRYQTTKRALVDSGIGPEEQSESEIMENIGYVKVWDCGNIKYIWESRGY